MTEAAESGERAARAALEDAMSLNVPLDTLYSAGLIASPGTHGGRRPRRNLGSCGSVAEHILGASRRDH